MCLLGRLLLNSNLNGQKWLASISRDVEIDTGFLILTIFIGNTDFYIAQVLIQHQKDCL